MNKLEEIKNKIQSKGSINNATLESFIEHLESKASEKIKKSYNSQLVKNIENLVSDIKNLIDANDGNYHKIIEHLATEQQKFVGLHENLSKSDKVFHEKVVNELKEMAKNAKEVKVTNQISKNDLKTIFNDSVDRVKNLLNEVNQVPDAVSVSYNQDSNVSAIVEDYGSYTLTTKISYNDNGQVKTWRTTKT